MITDPLGIAAVLLALEAGVFFAAGRPALRRFCSVVPSVFWIYFLPMLAVLAGLIPRESPVYAFISTAFLPASLILLLLSVDIRSIARLGWTALGMMFAGSLGIMLGAPLAIVVFRPWLPPGIWSGFGALSGSWIGGSANMLAVKESIGTPDELFMPMIIVDTIVAYAWMGVLIACAGLQRRWDAWNRSDTKSLDALDARFGAKNGTAGRAPKPADAAMILAVGLAGSAVAAAAGRALPEIPNVATAFTWTIVLATALGVGLSLTPVRRLESTGASGVGFALLYLVLASIGARADLSQIGRTPVLIAAGVFWVLVHAAVLLAAARLLRAPLFFAAVSSQANIGGPVSAPVVAAVYRPGLATVGVLMAVAGNIAGTALGIVCAHICRLVS